MKNIRCELCNEDYDESLMRYYQYTRDMNAAELADLKQLKKGSKAAYVKLDPVYDDKIMIRYFICEDCVIDHKKNKWNLGVEIHLFRFLKTGRVELLREKTFF